jgi:ComF family protein
MGMNLMDRLSKAVESTFFPKLCLGCYDAPVPNGIDLCSRCNHYLPVTTHHLEKENLFTARLQHKTMLQAGAAHLIFSKNGQTQKFIHQIKYHGRRDAAERVGEIFGKNLAASPYFQGIDCIIPVPMNPVKERIRGYNQADVFAQGLSTTMLLPIIGDALLKVKHNTSQTKKNKLSRFTNVEEIFVLGSQDLSNKHVLLVDDVLTTGATFLACADVLLQIPNIKISMVSIAITSAK